MLKSSSFLRSFRHLMTSSRCTSLPQMPECEFSPPGESDLSMERIMEIRSKHLSPTTNPAYTEPLLLTQGKMQWVWDNKGKRYLDLFGGIVTVSVGHCNPKVKDALQGQMDKLWHTTHTYLTTPVHEYAEKLAALFPGDLKVCFFTSSGSEANDLAMALARQYTKSFDLISLRNSYHGASPYTNGLTAHGTWKHGYANGFGIHHAMNPDPYLGPWGGSGCRDSLVQTDRQCACAPGECQACGKYLGQLDELLDASVGKRVAGFFAEPMQGVGGVVQYPKDYLKGAFQKIRDRGGLCIADEVQTGFGRTGTHTWGFQAHGVTPDIVTMAKGIGNGFPMAAVVTTPEIVREFTGVLHLSTYAGNPLACTVGSKVLDVMEEGNTQKLCLDLGAKFIQGLSRFRDDFDFVGDVRGKGLMLGLELVADKTARTPMGMSDVMKVWSDMKSMGLLVGRGGLRLNTLRMTPPMCIGEEDVDFALKVMRQAFENFRDSK